MKLSWRDGVHSLLEVPAMTRLLSLPTGKRVLQIGCGSGAALPALARHCKPVSLTGIDISTDALSQAAGLLREMRVTACLVHGDAQRMPFIDGSFDVVVDFGTCYRVADTGRGFFRKLPVSLTPAGIFVRETPLAQALAPPALDPPPGRSSFDSRHFISRQNAALWRVCAKR